MDQAKRIKKLKQKNIKTKRIISLIIRRVARRDSSTKSHKIIRLRIKNEKADSR